MFNVVVLKVTLEEEASVATEKLDEDQTRRRLISGEGIKEAIKVCEECIQNSKVLVAPETFRNNIVITYFVTIVMDYSAIQL